MAVQLLNPSAPVGRAGNGADLVVRDLDVVYRGGNSALSGVSLRVADGAFVSVLGVNGAGKTSLVRAITGLLFLHGGKVQGGSIEFAAASLVNVSPGTAVRHGIALVPEGRMLFPHLTVNENILCGSASRPRREDLRGEVERVYGLFPRLDRLRKQSAGLLSGGEQQMVAIGRALMARPRLLICDELSLGLAPMVVHELFSLFRKLNVETGMSILVIEQNAHLALHNSDYGYVLESGRVVVEGSSKDLRKNDHVRDCYLGGDSGARSSYAAISDRFARRQS